MQIYFLAPLNAEYEDVKNILKEKSHKIMHADSESQNYREYYTATVSKIKYADAVFSEVSTANANTGYEIAYALSISLPVYAFYKDGLEVSPMLAGCDNKNLHLVKYKEGEFSSAVEKAVFELEEKDTDYVMVPMSPLIKKYLDWVSQQKSVSKSTFIRSLIEAKILKDKAFKKDYS